LTSRQINVGGGRAIVRVDANTSEGIAKGVGTIRRRTVIYRATRITTGIASTANTILIAVTGISRAVVASQCTEVSSTRRTADTSSSVTQGLSTRGTSIVGASVRRGCASKASSVQLTIFSSRTTSLSVGTAGKTVAVEANTSGNVALKRTALISTPGVTSWGAISIGCTVEANSVGHAVSSLSTGTSSVGSSVSCCAVGNTLEAG